MPRAGTELFETSDTTVAIDPNGKSSSDETTEARPVIVRHHDRLCSKIQPRQRVERVEVEADDFSRTSVRVLPRMRETVGGGTQWHTVLIGGVGHLTPSQLHRHQRVGVLIRIDRKRAQV
jgi:hypothetical protein